MKNKKRILITMLAITVLTLVGCSEASKANYKRTDTIILEIEGYMSISNNDSGELVCTIKTGPETYKMNYVYLNEYTLYVVEDITGTHTDAYHYQIYFHTENPIEIETKP